ncbi:VWA domain-containing protein [Bacillus tianshenii]|uniref:vWA domain-containing protein n=1 Tax=Sutcliffiella tianshenii TaxID=1463404 RepID=UPI001CD210F8|nr:vWA domain-containing protein [Bacillus tianshenii]MCA1321012.1 VWA domain-containing protein [Bacillus tianshenii]
MMKNNLTEIIFLLDRSGSMSGLEQDTIGGFNTFIQKLCEHEGDTLLTTVLFDSQYEILWNGVDAKSVTLTDNDYFVRGTTALLDAVGKTILDVGHRLANTEEDQRPKNVIFVITTDGEENSSREFTYAKVRDLIHHQQEKYSWEFIFMGANIDSEREAGNLGISKEMAYNFEATETGMAVMYDAVCEMVSEKRGK